MACLLLIALSFGLFRGYVWVRDHTELLPQGESWVTPRSLDRESRSLLQATGGSAYAFDVALADDNEGYKLQLELWTEEGMEECWPILEGAGPSPSRHGRLNLFVFLNVNPPEDTTLTCGLSFEGLPCPNLCTGGENFHGRFEYIPADDMETITNLLAQLMWQLAE